MTSQVPLGRRNLMADGRRLVASVTGIGLAVMLVLLLDGMWTGLQRQAVAYSERVGADLFVLQPGVRDLTAGASVLPVETVETVQADAGVTWAAPVRTAYAIFDLHGRKVPAYVVGSAPGAPGGPWSLAEGRAPAADGEITLGTVLARRHAIAVGDQVDVFGRRLRVVGLSATNGFMLSYAFVTHAALEQMTAAPGRTSFVIAGAADPTAAGGRLRALGLNVLGRDEVSANNLRLATGIFGSPLRLMVAIGLVAGTLIIALTAYTAVHDRRREYGIALTLFGLTLAKLREHAVVKALGATTGRLAGVVLAQAAWLVALAVALATVAASALAGVVGVVEPAVEIRLTAGSVARVGVAAFAVGALAAVVPLRRVAGVEPATAFRRAT